MTGEIVSEGGRQKRMYLRLAEREDAAVRAALKSGTFHEGPVLFLPAAHEVARELDVPAQYFQRRRPFEQLVTEATQTELLHQGIAITPDVAGKYRKLAPHAGLLVTGNTAPIVDTPGVSIESLAAGMPTAELAQTIDSLSRMLAERGNGEL